MLKLEISAADLLQDVVKSRLVACPKRCSRVSTVHESRALCTSAGSAYTLPSSASALD